MNKHLLKTALIAVLITALCGCNNGENSSQNGASDSTQTSVSESTSSDTGGAESTSSDMGGESSSVGTTSSAPVSDINTDILADLTGTLADAPKFECSDGWTNGSMFNCTWRKSNVIFSDGSMKLKIDLDGNGEGKIPYSGAEFRSKDFYGYGMYEVVMKPIKNDGVVSSFFTYTGPTDNNPWDEIDIEFLGKDTTKVQFNYYTDGKGNHEYMYDLGFDASEDFHTYGFDWQEGKITWYVDGKSVYSAEKNIPTTPGKIMMNVWPGTGVDGWLKAYDGTTPLTAEYKSVDYREETEQ